MILPHTIKQINDRLQETNGRVIIGVGCSFVQGMGAWDAEVFEQYDISADNAHHNACFFNNEYEEKEFHRNYIAIDVSDYEQKNAFTHVLANKYLDRKYTPINLGKSGNGNRASISQLYLHPEINWDSVKEGVVVYCPSGLERTDFINDTGVDHGFEFITIWPNVNDNIDLKRENRQAFWHFFGKTTYSEKYAVLEQIVHFQNLKNWCKYKNLELIIVPGFDERYEKEYFRKCLHEKTERDMDCNRLPPNGSANIQKMNKLLEQFDWDKIYTPQGEKTFIDLCLKQENLPRSIANGYFSNYYGKGSENWWISPCAHPSAKGHDLFASEIYNCMKERNYV